MEAVVKARAKGGVSSTIGGTWDGMVMILCCSMNWRNPPRVSRKVCSKWSAGGWSLAQIGQHGLRTAVGIDLGGNFFELLLVAPQVGVADLEQAIQGNIHHLVVQQLLAEILRAQAEIAIGFWQQIFPHEVLILAQSFDGRSVAGLELGQQLRVLHLAERFRNIILEKLDVVRHLLQRDFGVHPGRIADVLHARLRGPGESHARERLRTGDDRLPAQNPAS